MTAAQWDMFKNLVAKYGIVPKDAMPETAQSENTSIMNRMLNQALKAAAVHIREMAASRRRSGKDRCV